MANLAAYPKDSLAGPTPNLPVTSEIQAQLKHILASPSFQGSKRGQQFLEYVCLKALSGEMGCLKERSIAVEVFGRQPNSNMGDDTIVRVGAREVRKRLAQYYVTAGGKIDVNCAEQGVPIELKRLTWGELLQYPHSV